MDISIETVINVLEPFDGLLTDARHDRTIQLVELCFKCVDQLNCVYNALISFKALEHLEEEG